MEFEDIMLSEISQPEKDKYYLVSLTHRILKKKIVEKENKFVVTRCRA